jgi:hypothetical protein
MATKETIEKLKNNLQIGDQLEIARRTKLGVVSVNQFFTGTADRMQVANQTKIINAALDIIEKRQKEVKAQEKRASDLLD